MFPFYTSWKQKNRGFLFSGGIEGKNVLEWVKYIFTIRKQHNQCSGNRSSKIQCYKIFPYQRQFILQFGQGRFMVSLFDGYKLLNRYMYLWEYKQINEHKQPSRGRKMWSENMQQIYRRTPMYKCDLNKVAKQFGKSHFGMGVLR